MAERALSQLIPKSRPSPSQTCRKFLPNPVRDLVSIRFLRGPNRALAWALWSRQARPPPETVVHFNVSEHPTASGRTEQIVDASRNDPAPSSLLRDRDRIYGHPFRQRVRGMGIGEARLAKALIRRGAGA